MNRNAERDAQIAELRKGGMLLRQIAERFGISTMRASQICHRQLRTEPPVCATCGKQILNTDKACTWCEGGRSSCD
jgi:hypothetical protein